MAITFKRLVEGSQLTTGAVAYYTAPTATRTKIMTAVLVNTTAGAITATVHLVPILGAATVSNRVISAVSIAANASYTCPELVNQVLETGGMLQALASAAASISLIASGIESV